MGIGSKRRADLAKFPLFAQATPVTFTIGPGETLFIPCGWWHRARSLTPTISVALDALNASNWKQYRQEVKTMMDSNKKLKTAAAQTYLAALGTVLSVTERVGLSV